MMKRLGAKLAGLVVLVLVLAGPAGAEEARQYLPAGSVDVAQLIGPPPTPDSLEFQKEMAVVLWLQRTRTPAQVAFVEETLDLGRFVPLIDNELVGADGIELSRTLDDVITEVRAEYDALKGEFGQPRPFEVSDEVHPVGEARPVAAYPSGHAIRATVYARLLSDIFPEHSAALMDLAKRIGYGRVTAGVHFPSDIVAGFAVGNAYADEIVTQPAFHQAVERIYGRQPPLRASSD